MARVIFDPLIPYTGLIYGTPFSPGKLIKVQGLAPGIAYRFDINLQCGCRTLPPRDDVAVQISVRLLDGYITLNSLENGIWGEEQLGILPLKRNQKFEIIITCDFNQYKVSINGQHYCEFPQRINPNRITHLAIDGDVSIFRIFYESTTGNYVGGDSGNGLSQASAPIPTPPADDERDDFELIDVTINRPFQVGIGPLPPDIGFSAPPSYDAALDASIRPPYPTSGPVGMPRPTHSSRAPYPINDLGAPYPTSGSGMPYPTRIPTTNSDPHPAAGDTGVLRAPVIVSTTPFSTSYSCHRPARLGCAKKGLIISIGTVIFVFLIIIILVVYTTRSHSDTYNYSGSYDSHKNSYGSNSYNG